jgi:aerobic-type carbon monoxide dehydrogenase small subunit (CoxS/CutS family)
MTRISLTVDGARVADDVEPRMLLVQYLRERLGKTGTVIGCDTSNIRCSRLSHRRRPPTLVQPGAPSVTRVT